ncbi:MAG TPA: helix-turn-helix transcriptional regulator [Gemmatimonadaceae bacterium]|nr:helix-turn-helix transcriptional regulator [Gemmatimonadaceae bacterium]
MSVEQNVRLSKKEQVVLGLLIKAGRKGMYGLQLVAQSNGELRRGTVYVTLERMQDKGLVESKQEEKEPGVSGIPRRIYYPTWYGMRVMQAWERLQSLTVFRLTPQPVSTSEAPARPTSDAQLYRFIERQRLRLQ